MKIAVGADHRAFKLKEAVKSHVNKKTGADGKNLHDAIDFGCYDEKPVDYTDIARAVRWYVSKGLADRGILICGTGIGMSISANKEEGVRAALCNTVWHADRSRRHNDSNVLVLGAEYPDSDGISHDFDQDLALRITDKWLETAFDGDRPEGARHKKRVEQIGRKIEVSPSLLSKPEDMTTEALTGFIKALEACYVDSIHIDTMDGEYNPNNTWSSQGPDAIKRFRSAATIPYFAHLMIKDPLRKISLFNDSGCQGVSFHYEACKDDRYAENVVEEIRSYGRIAGVAIEPQTPVNDISDLLPVIDDVLVMTVKTGYSGQSFMDMTEKIRQLYRLRKEGGLKFKISVDGGINYETGKLCRDAGADVLVAASYIRKDEINKYRKAVNSLRGFP